ncbi:hypothetical protein A3F07_03440 [candidate division WWE3 bacterium RIFCSPHIGHO2_12_FULL_38_15]|uniref:LytR/CpsA/Psr regulator C-terminal domain-containing protein n=1 Tax=candidate division WWE3 bacterium RIFCSPHIGHO2_02_FULL_38_14 TaxID=1802620 RepID=A0A1F4V6N3_UNCKA|nr:MAG: hypothetical protein A2793_02945 [candidate division WWE3 bacterium RIFCSPHIGHO2_01_FULL_38_45]OGC48855.1 MAG: hypothetical protein A3F07_03440 [candidate division WWE3 bacterium RIFCSPHIGHO2_12_FULL_38_15]OGC52811.1 MAG: hypothetical protein A3D91_02130 [candidate division WWE3 bacterium RIFCSPHIGHO2_02_FULL_38_14]OGC53158.1 MAG: hypothetical protein A3B64_01780 [candidate division WWE3 bacterium RIFCSPLOWO2_01_FULL_37_24]HLB51998.1 LCP family protein [Patescibacteria group bacterium]
MKIYPAQRKKLRRKAVVPKKNYRKAMSLILLFLVSILFLSGVGFYRSISQKWASADSASSYPLQDKNLTSLLISEATVSEDSPVYIKNIQVFLFNSTGKKTLIYEISTDNLLDIPGKYGVETLSKVFALGDLSENGENEGEKLLIKSINKVLGINIDRYMIMEPNDYLNFKNLIENDPYPSVIKLSKSSGINSYSTNVSLPDMYEIFNTSAESKSEVSRISVDLSDDMNIENLDKMTRELTFDSSIAGEKKGVSILNGSSVVGIATYGSRIIENVSGHVLSTSNAQRQYEESMLIVDDLSSETAKYISEYFGFKNVVMKNQALDILENEIARSDITLILGFDIADTL